MSDQRTSIAISLDEAPLAVVQRTAHRFSGRHIVTCIRGVDVVTVQLAGNLGDVSELEREFRGALLDDVLRARVEAETTVVRRLIIEAALRSALAEPGDGA